MKEDTAAESAVEDLARFIRQYAPLYVITGAGCSTESGVFDYRDADGEWKRPPPVNLADFRRSHRMRQRYWARSMRGYPAFAAAEPNVAHHALATLEVAGFVDSVVTQNVDDLHQRARQGTVIALHGSIHSVTCRSCGNTISRTAVQDWLEEHNETVTPHLARAAPDGDADLVSEVPEDFSVPVCGLCSGMFEPDVVFFGGQVPRTRVNAAFDRLDQCRGLLIVGSSVMVYSSYRFCRAAHERRIPLAAVNRGKTRVDSWLALHIHDNAATVLDRVCTRLGVEPQP